MTRGWRPRALLPVAAAALSVTAAVLTVPTAVAAARHHQFPHLRTATAAVHERGDAAAKGRRLHYCYGRVSKIDDGDTINVHLTSSCPGGHKGHLMVIRNAAIQATEVAHGAGGHFECWSKEGMRFFRRLMPIGHRVRLSSYRTTYNPITDGEGHRRLIKYVDTYAGHGRWVDVQAAELQAGLALWKPEPVESAHDGSYNRDMQVAMSRHLGMWGDPLHCSSLPSPGPSLQAWIAWKTDGRDTVATADQEYFAVRNSGLSPVSLSGWKIRDASHVYFHNRSTYLPLSGVLAPGDTLRIYAGHGTNRPLQHVFYAGQPASRLPFFGNAPMGRSSSARSATGAHPSQGEPGGALYLLDPKLDFRAWAVYPCVYHCAAPPQLAITAASYEDPAHEYFRITNVGTSRADLTGDTFDADGWTKNLTPGAYLDPGETMTLHVQGNHPDTRLDEYWGHGDNLLANAGETVWLRTAADVTIAVRSWGDRGKYNYYK